MKMTIEQAFSDGIIAVMKQVDETRVTTLFADDKDIDDFDFNFFADYGECELSHRAHYGIRGRDSSVVLGGVLYQYYESWKRIKEALEAEYDLLWTGGGETTHTETRHEAGTNASKDALQNALNAFNGETESNTDSAKRDTNGEHNINETIERKTVSKQNSVSFTQAEVVEKELNLRMRMRFYDIVANDIAKEICARVY